LFAAVVCIGSSSSQNKHFNSVGPLEQAIGTILFPQCKQRVTLSIASPPRFSFAFAAKRWNRTLVPAFLSSPWIAYRERSNAVRCRSGDADLHIDG
jgi:hypothetical protein